eukprot:NODE_2903_length_2124_cov_11.025538.p1 GENE.NODE_2903_length_2124_cov_11.025538~~NODE_2903_length_2124_cov_11.025538.p1  ORF type:complete len:622 (-),score=234.01 NODE_2903_length_2124_cov_11.025538:258-1976(-)
MANLKHVREAEAAKFAEFKATHEADIAALTQAIAALSNGLGGASFLQGKELQTMRNLLASQKRALDVDVEGVIAFLARGREAVNPGMESSEILGMLKQIKDDMAAELSAGIQAENAAIEQYNGLMAANTAEVNAIGETVERDLQRNGASAVEVVRGHDDLEDMRATLTENKAFFADLEKNCATRHQEFEEQAKTRAEELRALQETIKILSDDDALELFKKTLPSAAASFVQVTQSTAHLRQAAIVTIRAAQRNHVTDAAGLDFIALAIQGKQVGFGNVIAMIDDMVENLHKSQQTDEKKKAWCDEKIDTTNKDKSFFERSIADTESETEEAKQTLATVKEEIMALQEVIAKLDKAVAEASAQRKEEHAAHTAFLAENGASKQLIGFARNRLQKFYNPKLYKAPKKEELSREGRIYESHGNAAFAQVSLHKNAPEAASYAVKHEENSGVMEMLSLLVKDLDKQATEAKVEEENTQADYKQMMQDSSMKRAASVKSVTMKVSNEATLEEELQTLEGGHASLSEKLTAKNKYLATLHEECDWLLQNYQARQEARTSEIDALGKSKAVLNGADYSM